MVYLVQQKMFQAYVTTSLSYILVVQAVRNICRNVLESHAACKTSRQEIKSKTFSRFSFFGILCPRWNYPIVFCIAYTVLCVQESVL